MGFLSFLGRHGQHRLAPIPKGSFTVDRQGRIMSSTLPRAFPKERLPEIGQTILNAFRTAKEANISLTEVLVRFGALKVQAREMRGGAIVFLVPQQALSKPSKS
jgi:hypothetical protein